MRKIDIIYKIITMALILSSISFASQLRVLVKTADEAKLVYEATVIVSNIEPVLKDGVLEIGNIVYDGKTSEKGEFVIDDVDEATYRISVSKDGFKTRVTTKDVRGKMAVASLRVAKEKLEARVPLGDAIEMVIATVKGGRLVRKSDGSSYKTWGLSAITIPLSEGVENILDTIVSLILLVPAWVFIVLIAVGIYFLAGWKLSLFSFLGLMLIWNMGLWGATVNTIVLVLVSTAIAILLGVPVGIVAALNPRAHRIITPILDFMQTMPAFVYLIPAVPFFGITPVSAIFAIVIFAIPPAIRLTALGIKQISEELIEASDSFGATKWQKLLKLQMPLALPTIMAGVNQTIMLALSMVVIASMIGAGGLGVNVLEAIQQLELGKGFEAGIAVVIIAMILDRVTQHITRDSGISKKTS